MTHGPEPKDVKGPILQVVVEVFIVLVVPIFQLFIYNGRKVLII